MSQCILIGKVVSDKSINDDLTIVNVDTPIAIKGHLSICDKKTSIIANKISCITFNG